MERQWSEIVKRWGLGQTDLVLSLVDCRLAGCLPMLMYMRRIVDSGQVESSRAGLASDHL